MTAYEDEIDLRPYILAVLRNWWKIGLLGALFAIITFFSLFTRPDMYEATATILLTRSRPTLSLAASFPTVAEPVDARSRMAAILSISQSDALAVETIRTMGDALPESLRNIEALRRVVQVVDDGDAILVTASNEKPDVAAAIANEWSRQLVTSINSAYNSEQPLTEIQSQLQVAQKEYAARQADLQTFYQSSQAKLLEGKYAEVQALFDKLAQDRATQFAYYAQRKQAMDQLLVQAEALQEQLKNSSASDIAGFGDAIAVLMARATAFGVSPAGSPIDMEVSDGAAAGQTSTAPASVSDAGSSGQSRLALTMQLSDLKDLNGASGAYVQDLGRIITLAKDEKAKAEESLQGVSQQVLQGENVQSVEAVASQVQSLKASLEAEKARERELVSQRDLSWQAFQALSQKEAEIKNGSEANNQVNLAFQAYPPENPISSGSLIKAFAAGIIGLFFGIAIAIVISWLNSLKYVKKN